MHELGVKHMDNLLVHSKQPPEGRLGRNLAKPVEASSKQTRKAAADARPAIAMEEKEHTKRMKKQSQKKLNKERRKPNLPLLLQNLTRK